MRSSNITNRELDELGKRLVKEGKAGNGEIDRIVSSPRLYDGVIARIAAMPEPAREKQSRFAWKPIVVTAAVLVLLSVPLLGYLKFSGAGGAVISQPRRLPYTVDPPTEFVADIKPPQRIDDDEPKPVHAVLTKPVENIPPPKSRNARKAAAQQPSPVFHPIGLTEKAEDAAIDGRVVRVEMPRSALYAMGVDVPLENGTRAIKADILVGADGSPRAIRLVE